MHKITLKSVDLLVLEWFFMVLAWPLELHVRVRSHSQHPPLNGSSRTARTNIYARNLKIVGPCWHVAPLSWPTLPPLNAPWSMFSPSNLFLLYAKIAKSLARQKTSKLTLCFFLEQTVCVQAAWRPWAYVGTNQTRLAPPHISHAFRHMLTKMSKHVLHCASNALRREVKHPLSNHQIPKPPLSSGWTQENTLTHTHKYSQKTLRDLPCRDTPFSSAMLKPEGLGLSQMFPYCPYLDPPPF